MTAATLLKRINSKRKDIVRYEKEIKYYTKEYCGKGMPEHMVEHGNKWIEYYRKLIAKTEAAIADMSKEAARLANKEERDMMIKAMAEDMAKNGFKVSGLTTNGLRYNIYGNTGVTERSRNCYSMNIEGKGTVFTSGTLETVAEYIINN